EFEVSVFGSPTDGSSLVSAEEYLNNLRAYGAALRSAIIPAPAPIAGLYWFDDRLYAAVNAPMATISVASTDPQPTNSMRVRWNGGLYYTTNMTLKEEGSTNVYTTHQAKVGTDSTVNDNLVQVAYDGSANKTWATALEANGLISSEASDYATI